MENAELEIPDELESGPMAGFHAPEAFGYVPPAQFYDARRRAHPEDEPYANLLMAVLEDAIRLFQGQGWTGNRSHKGSRQRLYWEAREWLFEDHPGRPPLMSFVWVCEQIGIEPEYMRTGLRRMCGPPLPRQRNPPDTRTAPSVPRVRIRQRHRVSRRRIGL